MHPGQKDTEGNAEVPHENVQVCNRFEKYDSEQSSYHGDAI